VSIAGLAFGVNITRTRLTETIRPTNPKDILDRGPERVAERYRRTTDARQLLDGRKPTISNRTGQHVSPKNDRG